MFDILGIITPADFHIFQRGRYTTNQYNMVAFLIILIAALFVPAVGVCFPGLHDQRDVQQNRPQPAL